MVADGDPHSGRVRSGACADRFVCDRAGIVILGRKMPKYTKDGEYIVYYDSENRKCRNIFLKKILADIGPSSFPVYKLYHAGGG